MRSRDQPTLSRRAFITGGAVAAGIAGSSSGGNAQETDDETVTIDMTDELVFDPADRTVPPGTTVVWENVGTIGHSVTAYDEQIPDGAEYFASGDLPDEQTARQSYPGQGEVAGGETFEHTFEVEGEYEYFCIPHESVGMVASLTVGTEAAGSDGGGDVLPVPELPDSAIALGVAATVVMLSVIVLSYVFITYGGDYGTE